MRNMSCGISHRVEGKDPENLFLKKRGEISKRRRRRRRREYERRRKEKTYLAEALSRLRMEILVKLTRLIIADEMVPLKEAPARLMF
jgi:hypothetical protein